MGTNESNPTDATSADEQNTDHSDDDRAILQSMEFSKALLNEGYDDPMVLTWETAKQVMTEKRLEIIETLGGEASFESHRELARCLDRDIAQVQRDLDLLYDIGVLNHEDGVGTASKPVLATETLVVSPLVVDGERLSSSVNYTGFAEVDEDDESTESDSGETTTTE